jgi:hypothetical protein
LKFLCPKAFSKIVNSVVRLAFELTALKHAGVKYSDFRTIASIAVTVAASHFGVHPAMAGFMSGSVSSGNIEGALQGAFSAYVFYEVGQGLKAGGIENTWKGVMAHGVAGCVTTAVGGGKCAAGALSAAFTKAVSIQPGMERLNQAAKTDLGARFAGTAIAAVMGGTGSVLGGGKFENGAITGAFSYLFNQLAYGEDSGDAASPESNPARGMSNTAADRLIGAALVISVDGIEFAGQWYGPTRTALLIKDLGEAAYAAYAGDVGKVFSVGAGLVADKLFKVTLARSNLSSNVSQGISGSYGTATQKAVDSARQVYSSNTPPKPNAVSTPQSAGGCRFPPC